jgi:VanZ family protein
MKLTLAYALGLIVLLLLADCGILRDLALFVNGTFLLDKAIHFAMFGVLALMANATLLHQARGSNFAAIATGSILVIGFATVEEASNAFVSFRSCSLADLAANYLGIVCVGILPLVAWQRARAGLSSSA